MTILGKFPRRCHSVRAIFARQAGLVWGDGPLVAAVKTPTKRSRWCRVTRPTNWQPVA